MNLPKMRFCRAMPAPDAQAARTAIACRASSTRLAKLNILYRAVAVSIALEEGKPLTDLVCAKA